MNGKTFAQLMLDLEKVRRGQWLVGDKLADRIDGLEKHLESVPFPLPPENAIPDSQARWSKKQPLVQTEWDRQWDEFVEQDPQVARDWHEAVTELEFLRDQIADAQSVGTPSTDAIAEATMQDVTAEVGFTEGAEVA